MLRLLVIFLLAIEVFSLELITLRRQPLALCPIPQATLEPVSGFWQTEICQPPRLESRTRQVSAGKADFPLLTFACLFLKRLVMGQLKSRLQLIVIIPVRAKLRLKPNRSGTFQRSLAA